MILHQPMLATPGDITRLDPAQWAFEGKWDGYRAIAHITSGGVKLYSRTGRDITSEFPSLKNLGACNQEYEVLLDGEVVAPDAAGVPSFSTLQSRLHGRGYVEFWAFDILRINSSSLIRATYADRRKALESISVLLDINVPLQLAGDGESAIQFSHQLGWEGIVAKRRSATYRPGVKSADWIKYKHAMMQEVIIGGWRGSEARPNGISSLLMGIPRGLGLQYVGSVSGFSEKTIASLSAALTPLVSDVSPFDTALPRWPDTSPRFVHPFVVGEVRFQEWTDNDMMRSPVWRGLRTDKSPHEVCIQQD